MRIARIAHAGGVHHAALEGDTARIVADPFGGAAAALSADRLVPLAEARLLAPVLPRTLVGMAHNTGLEDRRLPPQAFLKAPRSVIGPGEPVALPPGVGRVDAEAELAVVLAGSPEGHTLDTVLDCVFGCTVANDITARDLQRTDPLWTSAKGRRGFTPLGPWIETDLDALRPDDTEVALSLDGVPLPPASTRRLARGIAEILCHLGDYLPLGPGDVVLTGAPGAYGPLRPGGEVSASVAGIGTLTNPVTGSLPGAGRPAPAGDPV
ncbi:fumarylacetoacetate hydrolase family protein [Streptomyces xanthii]|uniref:Fumarylacetoacetate hydrolase family protein n=1 Tax=Streptomyces xanthii TaxID=2768069 RepID=A0A7H1BGG3_9ACTN|nr:fumarylacetoacetate hydrolase family protein [Streptomyces xanthii]QNS07818.1 fumarylacetoacetate hydrolase family protein [Streptomyces xanthii]